MFDWTREEIMLFKNRQSNLFIICLALLAIFLLGYGLWQVIPDPSLYLLKTQIKLVRGGMGGTIYSVTINGDGNVQFEGGIITSKVSMSEVKRLVHEIGRIGFFSFEDSYMGGPLDGPAAFISVQQGDRQKKIVHSTMDENAPEALFAFECLIDEIAHTDQWTGYDYKQMCQDIYNMLYRPPAPKLSIAAEHALRSRILALPKCSAPCFWGITPGKTTRDDAANILSRLKLEKKYPAESWVNNVFYAESKEGLLLTINLSTQDNSVNKLDVFISHESPGDLRDWQVMTPETIISQYGRPTDVSFKGPWFGDRLEDGYRVINYNLLMKYGDLEFIQSFSKIEKAEDESRVYLACPLLDRIGGQGASIQVGPETPDPNWIPIEEAMNMTIDEFLTRMAGGPKDACFHLK